MQLQSDRLDSPLQVYIKQAIIMDNKQQTYTFEEAFKASVDYFGGDELAAKVWVNKYAVKDSFGKIYENPR